MDFFDPTDPIVEKRKKQVDADETCKEQRHEHRPARIEQDQVGMNISPGSAPAFHVELAVVADHSPKPGAVLLRETGIEIWLFHGLSMISFKQSACAKASIGE